MSGRQRVRIESDRGGTTAPVLPAAPPPYEEAYVRGLMRAQLRLALGCLLGFAAAAGALLVVILVLPRVVDVVWFGVPLPWLLHAYGFYPLILVFALVYLRGASRREHRYSALADDET